MTDSLCECGGTGEVPATPGQPGDGPMPCPKCQPSSLCRHGRDKTAWPVVDAGGNNLRHTEGNLS